jgi:hypothetical protein
LNHSASPKNSIFNLWSSQPDFPKKVNKLQAPANKGLKLKKKYLFFKKWWLSY